MKNASTIVVALHGNMRKKKRSNQPILAQIFHLYTLPPLENVKKTFSADTEMEHWAKMLQFH